MKSRVSPVATLFGLLACAGLAAVASAAEPKPHSQTTMAELVTLRGPLGGEISGRVDDAVKNLGQVKVGDLVTIGYFQSVALSATKKGEANPLFTGGDAATSGEGKRPAGYVSKQVKRTVTVVAVDAEKRSVVFQGESGTLFPVEVERPEFAQKLQTLKVGDQLDVVVSEAVIAMVEPAGEAKPSISREVTTLIVDRGEVVKRLGNTLVIRNEKGRMVKVTVDPTFKFMLDGKEVTVEDLKPGTKLTRTAFRVVESTYVEGE